MESQLPPPQRSWHSPQFSVNVYCGQTAGWMKTPLGTEIHLGRGHIVLDTWGPSPPTERAKQPPCFRPMSIVATVTHLSCGWTFVSFLYHSFLFCFASVRQIKLATRQLLGAREYNSSYHIVSCLNARRKLETWTVFRSVRKEAQRLKAMIVVNQRQRLIRCK